MPAETDRWEERWSSSGHWAGEEPAAFLREVLPFLPKGHALDLAAGGGRNSVFLAENGWHVTGIDKSAAALEKSAELAQRKGIAVTHSLAEKSTKRFHNSLDLICADVESSALPRNHYDVVLCFNFLLRSLTTAVQSALRPGGILVFETYTLDQL
ncbi:MAG: class I SAM-dependent methyltransferase, partial [Acidobacteria bacterium]|nr:class I SAM-dependent methyltransferase [Acidobacteriota bacterium]